MSCQSTNQLDGDLGGQGEDVSAGDDAWAGVLQGGLDVVHHGEPPRGAVVGVGCLLAAHRRGLVEQQRRVTTLHEHTINRAPFRVRSVLWHTRLWQLPPCMGRRGVHVHWRSSRGSGGGGGWRGCAGRRRAPPGPRAAPCRRRAGTSRRSTRCSAAAPPRRRPAPRGRTGLLRPSPGPPSIFAEKDSLPKPLPRDRALFRRVCSEVYGLWLARPALACSS